jgi:hypothetical protein
MKKTIKEAAQEYAERCTYKAGAERTKKEIAFRNGAEWMLEQISSMKIFEDDFLRGFRKEDKNDGKTDETAG